MSISSIHIWMLDVQGHRFIDSSFADFFQMLLDKIADIKYVSGHIVGGNACRGT